MLQEKEIKLSKKAMELLALDDFQDKLLIVEEMKQTNQFFEFNTTTCMATIQKSMDEERSVSMVVIGTEHKTVLVLEPSGTKIKKSFKVKGIPVCL